MRSEMGYDDLALRDVLGLEALCGQRCLMALIARCRAKTLTAVLMLAWSWACCTLLIATTIAPLEWLGLEPARDWRPLAGSLFARPSYHDASCASDN